jgi:hypothetical protein
MDKNMRKILILLIGLLIFSSCEKTEIQPNNPTIVVPPYTGPTVTPQSMVGTKWVITSYRVGQLGTPITISDTLKFETITNYKYNNIPYTYSFYVTGSVYNLTMNYTPWGNLSGSVNDNNMTSGLIQGTKFVDISLGSSNNTEYYLWIKKI